MNRALLSRPFAGAVLPAPVLDAIVVFGVAGHTPLIVSTTAFSGTSAAGGSGALAAGLGAWAGLGCAGVMPGWACPQASVPNSTHSNQLLRIQDSSRIGRSGSWKTRT